MGHAEILYEPARKSDFDTLPANHLDRRGFELHLADSVRHLRDGTS